MVRASFLVSILFAACGGGGGGGAESEPWPEAKRVPRPRVELDAGVAAEPAPAADAGSLGGRPPGSGGVVSPMDVASPSCPDPVVGVWVAKTHANAATRWHEHRLSISRDADGELSAIQTTRMWDGGVDQALPPLCDSGGPDWGVTTLRDDVRFVDGILTVTGLEILDRVHTCGGVPTDYSLDRFTGRIRRDTYPAVNNDGSQAVNRPYHFRRIACEPE